MTRGITTGLNNAFLIDDVDIAALDEASASLLRPYLGGKDLNRWSAVSSGKWILKIPSSANASHAWSGKADDEAEAIFAKTYPAVYRRFNSEGVRESLRARDDKGRYYWELRSCYYWDEFDRPKICSNKVTNRPTFCVDIGGSVLGNTAYFFAHKDSLYLCALLNSSIAEFIYRATFSGKQNGFYEVQPGPLNDFPIVIPEAGQSKNVSTLVKAISMLDGNPALEQLLNGLVYELYFPDELHARGLRLPRGLVARVGA